MSAEENKIIYVVTHKAYVFPQEKIFVPVQAGAALTDDLGYQRDDDGINISRKNPGYCELTALYWAWKNSNADYIGICHYRRYFGKSYWGSRQNRILDSETLDRICTDNTVVLPRKRNYYIETNYSQYIHAHNRQDLDKTREIIKDLFSDYLIAYDRVMEKTAGHRFNMMIMRRDILDSYCSWLFDILFRLEETLDISSYSDYNKRVFGCVGERLLDVWIEKNGIQFIELPVVNTERQHWIRKILSFLIRKVSYVKNSA